MAKPPQSHPGIPAELDRYLTTAEKIVFRTRLHWIKIVGPWIQFFLSLLLLGILDAKLPRDNRIRDVLVVLLLLVLLRALWRTYEWYREWFVGTDRRLMLTLGIITRKVAMIPLGKVTDMRYDRPPVGQILGYGSFILESAGQDQAFREVEYVPNPDYLYRRISEELFTPSGRPGMERPAP
ncbi:MAG TPA: PH domain-containing protein, partial [Kineosporiaceae bacterium]|nr:PH domain-containing protein [Kineosporiaceae bacterium]